MRIIDTHCDALYKLQLAKRGKDYGIDPINFKDAEELDTNYLRLKAGNVMVQFFAVYIEPDVPSDEKWQYALEQIDLFYTEVLQKNPRMKHIRKWEDLKDLKDGEIGAVLAIEGAEPFGNDLVKLRHLYRLGVLSLGLTWNVANLCADGVGEARAGGLTLLGKEVVSLNNEHKVFTDVSHLSVKGFWDVMAYSDYPIASHSNAREICDHPRNLSNDQITALFEKGGMIHLVFNPPFIKKNSKTATITDLIKHMDHLCSLGGKEMIGFGSDFDGLYYYMDDLKNSSNYDQLINELLKYYSAQDVRGFAAENFLRNCPY